MVILGRAAIQPQAKSNVRSKESDIRWAESRGFRVRSEIDLFHRTYLHFALLSSALKVRRVNAAGQFGEIISTYDFEIKLENPSRYSLSITIAAMVDN